MSLLLPGAIQYYWSQQVIRQQKLLHSAFFYWISDTRKKDRSCPTHSWAQKVPSPNLLKRKCISGVARICIIIIFHLSKLWKAKFSILCDVIFLARLQENLTSITLRSERVKSWAVTAPGAKFVEAVLTNNKKHRHFCLLTHSRPLEGTTQKWTWCHPPLHRSGTRHLGFLQWWPHKRKSFSHQTQVKAA